MLAREVFVEQDVVRFDGEASTPGLASCALTTRFNTTVPAAAVGAHAPSEGSSWQTSSVCFTKIRVSMRPCHDDFVETEPLTRRLVAEMNMSSCRLFARRNASGVDDVLDVAPQGIICREVARISCHNLK